MVLKIYYSEGTSEPLLSLDGKEAHIPSDQVVESAKNWMNAEIEQMVAMSEQIIIEVKKVSPASYEGGTWKLPQGIKKIPEEG